MKTFKFDDSDDVLDNIGVLGEGSYGSVYKVMNKNSEVLALKVLPIEEDQTREDILREIEVMRTCKGPFIISYLNHMQKGESIYILMELCSAGSVSDIMQICNLHFSEAVVQEIIAASCLGLVAMHRKNILHRDIKGGNLLLNVNGEIKLGDFGVSAILRSKADKRKTVIGTPFWMSPEIIMEKPYDGKADVWAMGITLIEIAEQEPPYADEPPLSVMLKIPSRPAPKLQSPHSWSESMVQFLDYCLQKDVAKRATAEDLIDHKFLYKAARRFEKDPKSKKLARIVEENLNEVEAYRRMEARARSVGETENMDSDSELEEEVNNFYGYGKDESYSSNMGEIEAYEKTIQGGNGKSEDTFPGEFDVKRFVNKTLVGVQDLKQFGSGMFDCSEDGFGDFSKNIRKDDKQRILLSGAKEKILEQCRLDLLESEKKYKEEMERVQQRFFNKRRDVIRNRAIHGEA
eukprot:maker-scaffold_5-snap-gene-20.1-mRNA-1 protein AED:0.07 eAED:0.07 QI:95/0.83/0.85/1/0.5/0.42/7/192/460